MFRIASLGVMIALVSGSVALAQPRPITLNVWPSKVPGEDGKVPPEKSYDHKSPVGKIKLITDVSHPTLTVFRPAPEKDVGAAVVICPGGAYRVLAWDLEGTEVAQWLNSLGVTAAVLKYRVPKRARSARHEPPLQDAQRAVSLIRSKAKEWHLDPHRIGILGFSAGGHLAATTSTNFDRRSYPKIDAVDEVSSRPDFAVLVYPAYLQAQAGKDALVPEVRASKQSPPMFFAHAADDGVSAENSVALFLALRRAGVAAELHVYGAGGHGFGLRPSARAASTWPQRCAEWMRAQGYLKKAK